MVAHDGPARAVTALRRKFSTCGTLLLILLLFETCGRCRGAKSYKGYRLIRTYPLDDGEADDFMEELSEWAGNDYDAYKVWASPHKQHLDVAVRRSNMSEILEVLEGRSMHYKVLVEDLGRVIKKSEGSVCPHERSAEISVEMQSNSDKDSPEMSWCKFHRYSTVYKFMDKMAKRNQTTVDLQNIGSTYEGRNLTVLRINTADSNRILWIDAGMHGREWIGPAVVTYFIKQLVDSYDENKELVDAFEWYIMPVANPDGYEYSHTEDRLWKKTRTNHGSSRGCRGVDPNRNFNFQWMVGSSRDKCSDNYGGPAPETENNVIAMRDKLLGMTRHGKVVGFLTFHSYAQVWATPWGWTSIPPRTAATLTRVANAAVSGIKKVYGTEYVAGSIADTLGISSGSSTGWAYGAAKIPFVFHIELRDEGVYGYALPPELIFPTSVETFAGLKAALNEIREILDETKVITKTLNGIKTNKSSAPAAPPPAGSGEVKEPPQHHPGVSGESAKEVGKAAVEEEPELEMSSRKKRLTSCGRSRRRSRIRTKAARKSRKRRLKRRRTSKSRRTDGSGESGQWS